MSTRRSRVLSHPLGDSRSSALISVSESVTLADPGTVDALVAMRSEVPAAPCDRGVPQRVTDFAFPNGAQLMALFGSFPMGMLWSLPSIRRMPQGAPLWSPQEREKSWYRWRRLQNEVIPSGNCVRWRTTWGRRDGTGRVNYEFGYRVALERLWGKHPKVEVEQDPFAECPEDAKVMMDLS
ncbi:hypothetical protein B296_00000925 [Ensete ventricosum]|uniref:Uncharacterized protein n=1 Tax=Ensete ventricosum TaxID=4639 RepID=A0A427BAU7_ENSVE|nr:hypothetical protein B296_00000925 [Ensete ventricosum]